MTLQEIIDKYHQDKDFEAAVKAFQQWCFS